MSATPSRGLAPERAMRFHDFVVANDRPFTAHRAVVRLAGRDSRILEIGAAAAYVPASLAARGNAVIGVEPDATDVDQARACEYVAVGDIQTMPLPGGDQEFDTVVFGDILDQLEDPRAVLARVRPLINPLGRLIAPVSNLGGRVLFARHRRTGEDLLDAEHLHHFTRRTLIEAFESSGYRVTSMDVTIADSFKAVLLRRLVHRLAQRFPGPLAKQFVVVAEPLERRTAAR